MKIQKFIVGMFVVCLIFGVAACGSSSSDDSGGGGGGGGGSSTAKTEAEDAIQGFVDEAIDGSDMAACWAGTATTCDCSGGGTATVATTDEEVALTLNDCTTADGLVYTGTLTITFSGEDFTVNGTMTQFGECTDVTSSGVSSADCSGSFSGTCGGETYTCNLTEGDSACECT